MIRAILVAGEGEEFIATAKQFKRYLMEEVGACDVQLIEAGGLNAKYLGRELKEALLKVKGMPIVLMYNGHGSKYGWGYAPAKCFNYSNLARLLRNLTNSPLFILNDCCYGFSIVDALEQYKLDFPISVIAAGEQESFIFLREAIESWRARKNYDPCEYPYYIVDLSGLDFTTHEVIEGGRRALWRYRLSTVLHKIAPHRFKLSYPKIRVIFPEQRSSPEEIAAEKIPHYYNRPRWGERMDLYLFPKQLQSKF